MEQPFENPFLVNPPVIESDPFPGFTVEPEDHDPPRDELLENMTRLLLHMEAELQFKEAVIEILLRNHDAQEKIREDLKHLKADEFTDPLSGLARDRAFDQGAWEEKFEGFPGFENAEDPGFFQERPCYLAVISGLRAMQVAQAQYERYVVKSATLQKLMRQHNKLKAKYSSATKLKDYEIAFSGDTVLFLQQERSMLQETLEWERKQNQNLNDRLQILEKKLESQTARSTKVINLLLVEIERLSRILINIENQYGTLTGEEKEEEEEVEVEEEEYELFSDEESTYFNRPDHSNQNQSSSNYNTIKSKRKSRNLSERERECEMDNTTPVQRNNDRSQDSEHECLETDNVAHEEPSLNKVEHSEKSRTAPSLIDTANQFLVKLPPHKILVANELERTSFTNSRENETEGLDSNYWRENEDQSADDPWVESRSMTSYKEREPEVVIQATLTSSCVS